MSRFKVGDRVRIIASLYNTTPDGDPNLSPGNIGTVIDAGGNGVELCMDDGPRRVDNESGIGWNFFDDEVEMVESEPTA